MNHPGLANLFLTLNIFCFIKSLDLRNILNYRKISLIPSYWLNQVITVFYYLVNPYLKYDTLYRDSLPGKPIQGIDIYIHTAKSLQKAIYTTLGTLFYIGRFFKVDYLDQVSVVIRYSAEMGMGLV